MKTTKRLGFVLVGAFAALALAQAGQAEEQKAKAPAKASAGGKAVLIPAGELKWTTPPNSPPGV